MITRWRSTLKRASNHYYRSLAQVKKDFFETALKSSDTSNDWSIYNKHIIDRKKKLIPLLNDDSGNAAKSWDENFKLIEKRFYGTTGTEPSPSPPSRYVNNDFPPIRTNELMNTIDGLKNNTSGGPDNLSVMLVKSIARTISPCLLTIMNGILHLGHHPQP